MDEKLKKIYDLYLQKGLITEKITFDQWSAADEDQQVKLYDLGKTNGLFDQVEVDQFKTLWSGMTTADPKKKVESPVSSQEEVMESDIQVQQEDPSLSVSSGQEQVPDSLDTAPQFTGQFTPQQDVTIRGLEETPSFDFEAGRRRRGQKQDIQEAQRGQRGAKGTIEKDTGIERLFGKNEVTDFFGDIYRAGVKGFETGQQVDEALELFGKGGKVTSEDVQDYINAVNAAGESDYAMSDEMADFNAAYEKAGGGLIGFLKGIAASPTVINEIAITSITQMVNPATLAAAGATTAGFTAAGATGGAAAGGVGAIPGAIAGAVSSIPWAIGAAGATLEAGLSFSEFLQEEISEKGLGFDEEGIRAVLNDPQAMMNIRAKSAGRGIAIGIIDRYTAGLAGKVGKKVIKKAVDQGKGKFATNVRAIAAGTPIEAAGGAIGEAAARGIVGQEMDAAEIGFEAVGGAPGSVLSVGKEIVFANKEGTYKMGPDKKAISREEMINMITNTDDKTFAQADLEISGDSSLKELAEDRKEKLRKKQEKQKQLGNNLDNLSAEEQQEALDLETELDELESENTRRAKNRKKEVEQRLDEIYSQKPEASAGEDVDVSMDEVFEELGVDTSDPENIRGVSAEDIADTKKRLQEQKQKQNAIQESSTTQVDVQEQARDGETLGEGDAPGATTTEGEVQADITPTEETQVESADLGDFIDQAASALSDAGQGVRGRNVTKTEVTDERIQENADGTVEIASSINEEGNTVMAPKRKGQVISENLVVVDQTETDNYYNSDRFKRENNNVNQNQHEANILNNASKAIAAVSKVLPGLNVVLHRSENSYKDHVDVASRGAYQPTTNTIHINIPKATGKTIAHEILHAVLKARLGSEVNIQNASKSMVDSVRKAIAKSKNLTPEQVIEFENYAANFDSDVKNEEYLTNIVGFLAENFTKLDVPTKSAVRQFIDKIASIIGLDVDTFTQSDKDTVDLLNTIAEKVSTGEEISDTDLQALEEGGSINIGLPSEIKSTDKTKTELVFSAKAPDLSFVTDKDKIDITSLIKDIQDKNQKVWFWTADQLGRGDYADLVINDKHYLDAGPSYALDPANKKDGIIWASGMSKTNLEKNIANSDYVFLISGSPQRSKLFNRRVSQLLQRRVEQVGDFKQFKQEILDSKPVKAFRDILAKYDSFEALINIDNSDRKQFLLAIEAESKKKNTPLKKTLEKFNAFLDFDSLRDGFYKENDFKMNDVMLVLKPSSVGEKSNHSTYTNDIMGEVVGVPDKKINAADIMTGAAREKLKDVTRREQQAQVIAPYGSGIREVQAPVKTEPYTEKDVVATTDAKAFAKAQVEAIEKRKDDKLQVTLLTEQDAQKIIDDGGQLFMTEDGKAGAYVTKDGYMGGLFKDPTVNRSAAAKILQKVRIDAGGKFFDAFATYLEPLYIKNGFRPVVRMTFNEEFAPPGWEKTNLKSKPDNVFFVFDPDYKAKKGEGVRIEDYDKAYNTAKNFTPETKVKTEAFTEDGTITFKIQKKRIYKESPKAYTFLTTGYGGKFINLPKSQVKVRDTQKKLGARGQDIGESGLMVEVNMPGWLYNRNPEVKQIRGFEISQDKTKKATPKTEVFTPEKQYKDIGMTAEQVEDWKMENRLNIKMPHPQEAIDAANKYAEGEISLSQYNSIIKDVMPIKPYTEVPKVPTLKEIVMSLRKNKLRKGVVGLNLTIPDGTMIESRLDIPAYMDFGIYIDTLHNGEKKEIFGAKPKAPVGYGQVAVLNNVTFDSNPRMALKVAQGKQAKSPFAVMKGAYQNESTKSVTDRAKEAINSNEWVQVGFNPYRHAYFYDKANSKPVESADQIIQVGPLVLAKGIKYGKPLQYVEKNGSPMKFERITDDTTNDPMAESVQRSDQKALTNDMSPSEVIKVARDNNFSDAAIKDYLVRRRGFSVKEVTELLSLDANLFSKMPPSFGNIKGGAKAGLKLFKKVLNFRDKLSKKLSPDQVVEKTLEFLEKQPEYIAEGNKTKTESQQQSEMIIEVQKSLDAKPNKDTSKRVKLLKEAVKNRKRGAKELSVVKTKLRNFIRQALPKDLYTKSDVMSLINKVTKADATNIDNLTNEVIEMVTEKQNKSLEAKINSILNGKYQSVEAGRQKGKKIDNQTRLRLEAIKEAISDDAMVADDVVENNVKMNNEINDLMAKTEQTPDDRNRIMDLMVIININNAKLNENTDVFKTESLSRAENLLLEIVGEGKENFKAQLAEDHKRYIDQQNAMYKAITGKDIDFSDPESVNEKVQEDIADKRLKEKVNKGFKKAISSVGNILNWFGKSHESLSGLMDILQKTPGQIFDGPTTKDLVYRRVNKATRAFKEKQLRNAQTQVDKMKEIFGKKWKKAAHKNATPKPTGVFRDQAAVDKAQAEYDANPTRANRRKLSTVKKKQELELSDNQVGYLHNQYKDPANLPSFANPENEYFGPDHERIMTELRNQADPKVLEYADWMVDEYYPSLYDGYNAAYEQIYRTSMPWNQYYGGRIFRVGVDPQPLNLIGDKVKNINATDVGSPSTKVRVNNDKPIKPMDMMDTMTTYTTDMDWFSSVGPTLRDINKIFTNKQIRKSIEANHGRQILTFIDFNLRQLAARGINTAGAASFINQINNLFISTRLGANPTIMLKQLTSFIAYADRIGPINYAKYAAKNKAEFLKIFKEIRDNSVYVQDRMSGDIKQNLESYAGQTIVGFEGDAGLSFFNKVMMGFVKAGDIGAIYLGGMPAYSYYKAEFKKNNPDATEQQAIDYAIEKFEEDTKETQQSKDIQDKDWWQQQGPIVRSLQMFVSAPRQMVRQEFAGLRMMNKAFKQKNAKDGVKLFGKGFRKFATFHVVLPMFFQYVALGLPGLMKPIDDEDEEDLLRAAILGSFNSLFALGDVLNIVADTAQG